MKLLLHKTSQNNASVLLRLPVITAAVITSSMFIFITGYIIIKGIPNLSIKLFSPVYSSQNVSMLPALINTLMMTALTLFFAIPSGIGTSIWLVEYAKKGSRLVKIVRLTAETLSGIPSIVYGLFGFIFFVTTAGWGISMISGSATLAIMILPVIMRTAEEALLSVPDSCREGSFALGAGKLRTVFSIALPPAIPGILSGIILATGRIVGETAALIYTAGTVASISTSIMDSARTLAVHLYVLSSEGLYLNETYATAVVLLILVLGINSISATIAKAVKKYSTGEIK